MKKNNLILTVIAATVIAGAVGFLGGVQYQKNQRGSFQGRIMGQGGTRYSQNRNDNFYRPISGKITNIEENTITIKTQDGGSKTIVYSNTTQINRTTTGKIADLKTGEQITIFGKTGNTNNTITAEIISVGDHLSPFGQRPPGERTNQQRNQE